MINSFAEVWRELQDLYAGSITTVGEVSLDVAPATSTTVTRRGVSTNSIVVLSPTNAAAKTEGHPNVACTKGQFVLTHSSNASARTYRYIFFTPRRPL